MKPRIFTVPEANRLVPRVQRIVTKLEEWQPRLLESQERLTETAVRQSNEQGPVDHRERVRLSQEVERAEHEILSAAKELQEIGCVLKPGGLVDFFTVKNGILYELCWQNGEKDIRFYHEFDTGFNGRQPLTPEDVATMGVGFGGVTGQER